jgi:hypothetical protein
LFLVVPFCWALETNFPALEKFSIHTSDKKNLTIFAAALILPLIAFMKFFPSARKHLGWNNLQANVNDIRSIRSFEKIIPEEEAILINSTHKIIGNEHWLLPTDALAGILPYFNKRLAFEIPIRYSSTLTWEDWDDFCKTDSNGRDRFYSRHRIRWSVIYLPIPATFSIDDFKMQRFCDGKLSLFDLGFEFPARMITNKFALISLSAPKNL